MSTDPESRPARRVSAPVAALIGLLSAAVVGLGTVVAIDRTTGAPAPKPAVVLAAPAAATTADFTGLAAQAGGPMRLLAALSKEIGVPAEQIVADIRAGQTLDQIAGAKAAKLRADLLGLAKRALDKAVTAGAISSADESRLLNDAGDAIDVVMAAKLGKLFGAH